MPEAKVGRNFSSMTKVNGTAKFSICLDNIQIKISTLENAVGLLDLLRIFQEGDSIERKEVATPTPIPHAKVTPEREPMSDLILKGLKDKFGDSPFKFGEAVDCAKKDFNRKETTVRNAILLGVRSGKLFKIGQGIYSFKAKAEAAYAYDPTSILLICA